MRKVTIIVGALILLLGVGAIGGIFYYAAHIHPTEDKLFVDERAKLGRKLFDAVSAYDFEGAYPASPSAVMEQYADVLLLQYGHFFAGESGVADVVRIQRNFWTDALKAAATESEQTARLNDILAQIYANDQRLLSADVKAVSYDAFDKDLAIVTMSETWLRAPEARLVFYLKFIETEEETENGGRWLVHSFEVEQ